MTKLFARIVPFILLGMVLVGIAFGLVLFLYLVFFGALVGLALFVAAWVRDKFFPSKQVTKRKTTGRTIDHER